MVNKKGTNSLIRYWVYIIDFRSCVRCNIYQRHCYLSRALYVRLFIRHTSSRIIFRDLFTVCLPQYLPVCISNHISPSVCMSLASYIYRWGGGLNIKIPSYQHRDKIKWESIFQGRRSLYWDGAPIVCLITCPYSHPSVRCLTNPYISSKIMWQVVVYRFLRNFNYYKRTKMSLACIN